MPARFNEDQVGGFQKNARTKPKGEPKGRKDKNQQRGFDKRSM